MVIQSKKNDHKKQKGGNNADYYFNDYMSLEELFKVIYYRKLTIEEADTMQKTRNIKKKGSLLVNARNFYDGREMIINAFKNKIFPIAPTGFSSSEEEDKSPDSFDIDEFDKFLINSEKNLDPSLIKKYFFNDSLSQFYNYLVKSRGSYYNQSKMVMIKIRLEKIKNDMRNMSEDEIEIKK